MNHQSNMPRKGTRRALGATLTFGVIAIVLALNIAFSFVADRFMWQVDETVTRYIDAKGVSVGSMYTATDAFMTLIGESAIPMVEKMNAERAERGEEPITINIKFCAERDKIYGAEKLRMIQYTAMALQKEFPHAVKVEYLNIEQNPSQVQKYKATSSTNIYPHQIIFEFGTEYRVTSYDYFFLTNDTNSKEHWAYNGEQKFASLLLALTRAESPIAGFITNHGEKLENCQSFRNLVERAGFDVVDIDLSKDEIPADCRLLICYDPQTDFIGLGHDAYVEGDKSEIDKLDAFLDKAYSFMLFVNKDTPELTVLEEYMEEWGVTIARAENAEGDVDTLTIRDQVMKLDKDGYIPVAEYVTVGGGASITEDMRNVSYPATVVFPNATAIVMSESYRKTHVDVDETTGVTEAYTYGSYYRNGISRYFHDVFKTGASASAEAFGKQYQVATQLERFNLMTISLESRTLQETNYISTQEPSYVAVFGSTEFASDTVLDSASYGNADVLNATLRHMGREVVPANLEFKAFKKYDVDTNAYVVDAGKMIGITLFMTVMPVAVCVIAGVCVNVKRKYR
ncbi:MAG: hypothetical protein E7610_00520 [Ruminococcaceae bacterium]|nr:hypothetical protein [Oscillospiraceae bacterium]